MQLNPHILPIVQKTHHEYMQKKGLYFFEPEEELKNPNNFVDWNNIFISQFANHIKNEIATSPLMSKEAIFTHIFAKYST
jgi:hypothetical protein